MTSEPAPSPGGAGDVLGELTAVLAAVLDVAPDRIDPAQPFQILGLDSLLTVEFVAAVNQHFGVRTVAAALYDHPTPAALAGHVAEARSGAVHAADPARDPGAAAAVLQVLREQLARMLHCAPWEIDPGAAFAGLGLDSPLAAEFAAGVNRAYGLAGRPVTVHDHPNLADMAACVAARSPGPVTKTPAPAPAPGPQGQGVGEAVDAAGRRVPLSADELGALLDAVREARVSVDEAAALLTQAQTGPRHDRRRP
ncbi:phosphopantetheine-binding protein [Streptomyces sp. NPDC001984]